MTMWPHCAQHSIRLDQTDSDLGSPGPNWLAGDVAIRIHSIQPNLVIAQSVLLIKDIYSGQSHDSEVDTHILADLGWCVYRIATYTSMCVAIL